MSKQYRIAIGAAVLAAGLLYAQALHADWSFVMLGDTRGNDNTATGISPYLNTIAQKIASLNPELVMMAGDLCNGDSLNSSSPLYPADGDFTNETAYALYASEFAQQCRLQTVRSSTVPWSNGGLGWRRCPPDQPQRQLAGFAFPLKTQNFDGCCSNLMGCSPHCSWCSRSSI